MYDALLNRLIRRLEVDTAPLSEQERDAIASLPLTIRDVAADQDIVREGERPSQCCVVIEGFQCRYKMLRDGERQIMSFHVPGDIPDLQSLFLSTMDHSLGTITPNRVAFIAHEPLRKLIRQQPGIAERLWRETLIDASVFREWITNVGSRDAYTRIAQRHMRDVCPLARSRTDQRHDISVSDHPNGARRRDRPLHRACQSQHSTDSRGRIDCLGARRLHHTGFEGPAGRRDVRAELSAYARQRRGVRGVLPGAWLEDLDSNQD